MATPIEALKLHEALTGQLYTYLPYLYTYHPSRSFYALVLYLAGMIEVPLAMNT